MAQWSSVLAAYCTTKGGMNGSSNNSKKKKSKTLFQVPDAGLTSTDGESATSIPFQSLRNHIPLLVTLLIDMETDFRLTMGNDLADAANEITFKRNEQPTQTISLSNDNQCEPKTEGTSYVFAALRAMVCGIVIQLIEPGDAIAANEISLAVQFPRCVSILETVSDQGVMLNERPFWLAFARAALRHKSKLPHRTRDLIVNTWLKWFEEWEENERGGQSIMCAALHEIFILLLVEWSILGNAVLPRDKLLSFSEDAVRAAEASDECSFAEIWNLTDNEDNTNEGLNNSEALNSTSTTTKPKRKKRKKRTKTEFLLENQNNSFAPVKKQYERMMKLLSVDKAQKWKEKVGIDESSLAACVATNATDADEDGATPMVE